LRKAVIASGTDAEFADELVNSLRARARTQQHGAKE
jgi:hypothetical protein